MADLPAAHARCEELGIAINTTGPNGGIHALVCKVADADAADDWFTRKGLPLGEAGGDYARELVLDGARHWFRAG